MVLSIVSLLQKYSLRGRDLIIVMALMGDGDKAYEPLLIKKDPGVEGDVEAAAAAVEGDSVEVSAAGYDGMTWRTNVSLITEEVKRLGYLSGPMVAMSFSQYMLPVISIMFVGHLGELALSSTAVASSLATVTGFSFLLGMAGALETLCGQAYGAEQYHALGNQTRTAIFCLNLCCIPLAILWFNVEKILILVGQDPLISHGAGEFAKYLIPSLFAYATLQPLIRYFQMQSLVIPMLVSSIVTLLFHIPVCWSLVYKTGLGNLGAALAINLSYWLNVLLFVMFIKFSPVCTKTWGTISTEMFHGIWEFFRYAIPSAMMVCFEWWSFEMMILFAGLLPNPELETSILSICLSTIGTLYTIPYGLGAAGSTRVSNELGAGNPHAARFAVYTTLLLAIAETSIVSTSLFLGRRAFGYIFSNDKEVVDYVTRMAPLVCISVIMDSLQGVLSGVARGCGWQHIGAFVNLGAFYLCGIPIGLALAFWVKMGGMGLWIGVQCGSFVQNAFLAIITSCINWEKQARQARERIFQGH